MCLAPLRGLGGTGVGVEVGVGVENTEGAVVKKAERLFEAVICVAVLSAGVVGWQRCKWRCELARRGSQGEGRTSHQMGARQLGS